MNTEATERYLTVSMVAELLSCSASTVWRRCADGTLPKPRKFGPSTRWLASEINQYFADARGSEPHGQRAPLAPLKKT